MKGIKIMTGTVKWFNARRGFGFITADDGKDYFVHHSDIKMDGFRKLKNGAKVSFEAGREKAVDVTAEA